MTKTKTKRTKANTKTKTTTTTNLNRHQPPPIRERRPKQQSPPCFVQAEVKVDIEVEDKDQQDGHEHKDDNDIDDECTDEDKSNRRQSEPQVESKPEQTAVRAMKSDRTNSRQDRQVASIDKRPDRKTKKPSSLARGNSEAIVIGSKQMVRLIREVNSCSSTDATEPSKSSALWRCCC
jgi:hypothetical protein